MHAAPHRTTQRRAGLTALAVAVAAATACWVLALGPMAGAQDTTGADPAAPTSAPVELGGTNGDATGPVATVVDTPASETTVPEAVTDDGGSPAPAEEATSDEGLLNLIIIGLLVLAAVIAVATLLFWRSTAPVDGEVDETPDDPDDAEEPAPAGPVAATPSGVTPPSASAADTAEPKPPTEAEAAPRRRVMASFPSSPLGDAASAGSPEPAAADPPPAPVPDAGGADLSTLGSGASPGRPSVPPPDAVRAAPQPEGAYRIPAPDELPPQPDRPFADPETRPSVERAPAADAPTKRTLPQPPAGDHDASAAVVSTSRPVGEAMPPEQSDADGPPVVVRRRRRDRPAGPWGEGAGGGSRPEVPRMEPPEAENQGYQQGVRVIRPKSPDEPAKADAPEDGEA